MRQLYGEYGYMSEADVERFWRTGLPLVVQVGHWRCWEWHGKRDHRGYGRFWLNGQYRPAHRVLYEYINPRTMRLRRRRLEIPETAPHLDHRCNNRACLRHTRPVTPKANHQARVERYFQRLLARRARVVRVVHPLLAGELI